MTSSDFTTSFLVDQTPEEAFRAITNVRGWWSETIEGGTEALHDEFTYRYKDMHYSTQRVTEVVPGKKLVWLVTDSRLNFIKNKSEWTGTKISFDIAAQDDKTRVRFTHLGLHREQECFDACCNGWTYYINSLQSLIATGTGQPHKEEMTAQRKSETA